MGSILACVGFPTALAGVAVGVVIGRFWRAADQRSPHHARDTLTGVGTRATVNRTLRTLRAGDAVVVVDADDLKATNDSFGHGAGDAVLVALARHLAHGVRAGDTVARFGGDEFVVVLRGGNGAAHDVVERLRQSCPTSFSAGVSVHSAGAGTTTFAAADAALLAAKRAGGRRVVSA